MESPASLRASNRDPPQRQSYTHCQTSTSKEHLASPPLSTSPQNPPTLLPASSAQAPPTTPPSFVETLPSETQCSPPSSVVAMSRRQPRIFHHQVSLSRCRGRTTLLGRKKILS
ncbi:hypothetical protein IC582_002267 [Cucumis melo]